MNGEPADTVVWVLGMCLSDLSKQYVVVIVLFVWSHVEARPGNAKDGCKVLAPSWLDLIQDG